MKVKNRSIFSQRNSFWLILIPRNTNTLEETDWRGDWEGVRHYGSEISSQVSCKHTLKIMLWKTSEKIIWDRRLAHRLSYGTLHSIFDLLARLFGNFLEKMSWLFFLQIFYFFLIQFWCFVWFRWIDLGCKAGN